jgi:hypothetical protein
MLGINLGGRWHPIRRSSILGVRIQGKDCDACIGCGRHPQGGETIHFTSYGDVVCRDCAIEEPE